MKRRAAHFIIFSFLIMLCGCVTEQQDTTEINPKEVMKSSIEDIYPYAEILRHRSNSATVNNYISAVHSDKDGKNRCITFYRSGNNIHTKCIDDGSINIVTSPPPGTDINADGIPDIIVEYYSGGAHCCYEYALYSLGDKLNMYARLYGGDSPMEFKDIDDDGDYEVVGKDWTFAYWHECFAASPAPQIILRYEKGRFRLAENLMRISPPDEGTLVKSAKNLKRDVIDNRIKMTTEPVPDGYIRLNDPTTSWHWDSRLWWGMLDLIYTGNGDLAWKYCDWYWSDKDEPIFPADRKNFLREFKKNLSRSPYWGDLKRMNNWN